MRRFITLILLAAVSLGLPRSEARAASVPLPPDATIVLPGKGFGHGRGMGQWGAKGMADAGKSYTSILTHYYSGVTLATRSAESIRVLVERSPDVIVTSDAPFRARTAGGATLGTGDSTNRYFRVTWTGSAYRLQRASTWNSESWALVKTVSSYPVFVPGSSPLGVVAGNGTIRYYRGTVIARYASSDGMRAINELPMEHYLYGVVPRESISSWPMEALKSQATAARTYAVRKKVGARGAGTMFDICATTACQVYEGTAIRYSPGGTKYSRETARTNTAVDDTAGKVILYGGDPILAEYSSSTGGYTAKGNVPYQQPVPDAGDAGSPHHNWTARIPVSAIESRWPQIGRLVDIDVLDRNGYGSWGGRVLSMKVVGTEGSVSVSGERFRSAFQYPSRREGLRSSWFTVRYWRGEIESAPSLVRIPLGGSTRLPIRIKNTGTVSWPIGGYVRLATGSPSSFYGQGWLSPTRAASVSRNATDPARTSVPPGHVGEFLVTLHAGAVPPGSYRETLTAVADGQSAMTPSVRLTVEVSTPWIDEAATLVTNGSFEVGTSPWRGSGLTPGDGRSLTLPRHGRRAWRFVGGRSKAIAQTIPLAGGTSRRFVLGGWNRSVRTSASGGPIEVAATAVYADGITQTWRLRFPTGPHAWTYEEIAITTNATRPLARMVVAARFLRQSGEAFFDAVRLVETPLVNPSFEQGLRGWDATGLLDGDGVVASARRDGGHALALHGGLLKRVAQTVPVSFAPGERLVVGAWSRTVSSDPAGGPLELTLTLTYADRTEETVTLPFAREPHGWRFSETSLTSTKPVTAAAISISSSTQTGVAYFDGIRLVRSLSLNHSFETALTGWSTYRFEAGDGVVGSPTRDAGHALRMRAGGRKAAVNVHRRAGPAGRRFVLAGWSRTSGTSATGGAIGYLAVVRYGDGSSSRYGLTFPRSRHDWMYRERIVTARKRFHRVDVYAVFYHQTGTAFFDAVSLRPA